LVDSYAEGMLHQGYTESTLRPKVRLVGALSQWMHARQIPTTALDEGLVASFLAYVATRRHIADGDRAALRQLLQHLRQRGVVPPSSPESHQSKAVSTYLGHGLVADTYWYISATPELLRLAALRAEAHLEDTGDGNAS
jgi:hypothetical protein